MTAKTPIRMKTVQPRHYDAPATEDRKIPTTDQVDKMIAKAVRGVFIRLAIIAAVILVPYIAIKLEKSRNSWPIEQAKKEAKKTSLSNSGFSHRQVMAIMEIVSNE